jgi:hypothetical protein
MTVARPVSARLFSDALEAVIRRRFGPIRLQMLVMRPVSEIGLD